MSSVRILLITDDRLFGEGVANILGSDETFDVVLHEGLAGADRAAPTDVLVIDSRIDGALAVAGAGKIAKASLLIAAPNDAAWCREALCAGASGVLPKNSGAGALLNAVRTVADGSLWAPRRVMADCIRHLVSATVSQRVGAPTPDRGLSRREREIFRQAASGLANKELASRLAIGEATVKAHLTRIFQKLGVRGRAELAAVYHGVPPRVPDPPTPPNLFIVPTSSQVVVRQRSNSGGSGSLKK